jgi:Tfp pilus assembly protein PilX
MKSINLFKKKDGMALLTVMLIFLVMSILLGGIVATTNSNLRQSVVTKNHTAAFYASEAGLTKVSSDFEEELDSLLSQTPSLSGTAFLAAVNAYITSNSSETISLSNNNGEASFADVTFVNSGVDAQGYQNYTLTSNGFVGDLERVLVKTYRFRYTAGVGGSGFIVDKTVMVKNTFTLTGSAQIIGAPVSTYSKANSAISMDWSTKVPGIELDPTLFNASGNLINTNILNTTTNINAKVYCDEGTGLNCINPLDEIFEFPTIVMPGYPTKTSLPRLTDYTNGNLSVTSTFGINMSGWTSNITYVPPSASPAYYVPTISIANNSNFTINVGNNDILWVTDKIVLNGPMQVIGGGTLTIYLTGNAGAATTSQTDKLSYGFSGGTGYIGNITNPERVKILIDPLFYLKKVGKVNVETPITTTIGGSSTLYIALMAANLNLNLSGSGKIDGYVVTGGTSVVVTGGSSTAVALYYTPNANFELSGGGVINGAVLANNFLGTGGTYITYSDVAFINFPFEVLDPITGGVGTSPILELLEGSTIEQ